MGLIHVVDDEDIIRELVGETLRRLGHDVRLHSTPASLFDDEQLGDGAVIVTDMLMPQMDGFKLMERLRSGTKTRTTPIVAMTALKWGVGLEDRLKKQYAVEHVLQKPVRKEELIAAVSHYAPAPKHAEELVSLLPIEREIYFIGFRGDEAKMLASSLDYLARATIAVSLPEELVAIGRMLAANPTVPMLALIDEQTPVAVIAEVAAWARRTGARAAIVLQAMPFLRDVLSKDLGLAFIEAYEVPHAVSELLAISARRDPRVPLSAPLRMLIARQEAHGQLLDVSVGGARLTSDAVTLADGAPVQLGFALPPPVSRELGKVDARVRWVRRDGSGVLVGASFEKLVAEEARALETFIAARRRAVRNQLSSESAAKSCTAARIVTPTGSTNRS